MSFDGYFQLICENGHAYYEGLFGEEENALCPYCNKKCIWWNLVDSTNDCGKPITLELIKQRHCSKCGSILEEKYKIPKNKGHLKK